MEGCGIRNELNGYAEKADFKSLRLPVPSGADFERNLDAREWSAKPSFAGSNPARASKHSSHLIFPPLGQVRCMASSRAQNTLWL